jgi:3-oxoadipate enol-lactonase
MRNQPLNLFLDGNNMTIQNLMLPGPAGQIAVQISGPTEGPAVLMNHSILSSSMMWQEQASLLAATGWRVICADTRGHGRSECATQSCTMDDLVADSLSVLDGLHIQKAHYVGLSLGGMSGVEFGIQHSDRLWSMVLCDCRADMPAPLGDVWNDRMASAIQDGCQSLANVTTERWFGAEFIASNPATAKAFKDTIGLTQVNGFLSCAKAIQGLNYLDQVAHIRVPTTLIAGANDGPLPLVMKEMQQRISGSHLDIIPDAGHLPNIDQAQLFNAALMRHFFHHFTRSQA